jgi:ribonucleoside-triphosphate reductase
VRSIADIDRELQEKRRELEELQGTKTEIYTRIVGYYRSVRNWNRGKREEYRERVPFATDNRRTGQLELALEAPSSSPGGAAARDQSVVLPAPRHADGEISSVTYFYRQTCPNCKPVRRLISECAVSVRDVDVDTAEGMELAVEHQIFATPTALFADQSGNVVFRSSDPREIAGLLAKAV